MDEFDLDLVEVRMQDALDALGREFGRIRSGRATPALVDKLMVEAYGSDMPMTQVATISVPEPRTLVLQPFDKSNIGSIERSIHKANLGVSPTNDGNVIRLNMPPLTEERRKEYAKDVRKRAEEAKVTVRQARRDAMDEIKKSDFSEDAQKKLQNDVQKVTDQFTAKIDKAGEAKAKEIMEV